MNQPNDVCNIFESDSDIVKKKKCGVKCNINGTFVGRTAWLEYVCITRYVFVRDDSLKLLQHAEIENC